MQFADVIGHERQVAYFDQLLVASRPAHAYSFFGPKGIGKRALADRLAAGLLKVDPTALSTHPDVLVIGRPVDDSTGDRKRQIPLELIRLVIDRLALSAVSGQKVVIIEDADSLTLQAQNALLKTLEEPSGKALILLLAEERARVLPTIISRTVPVTLHRVSKQAIVEGLVKHGYTSQIAEAAADRSLGRPGIALALADAERLMAAKAAEKEVEAFLEAPRHTQIKQITALVKGDDAASLDEREDWLLQVGAALHRRLHTDSSRAATWAKGLSALLDARQAMRQNVSPALALETMALALS